MFAKRSRTQRSGHTLAGALLLVATLVVPVSHAAVSEAAIPARVSQAQPDIPYGGRFVAIDVDPRDQTTAIGASESGGLFKTTDYGRSWHHIDSLKPFRMADVRYLPSGGLIVATVATDPRQARISGIWLSTDGGTTWSEAQPLVASSQCTAFGAFGIAFGATGIGYVGTRCGLAILPAAGGGYFMVDPSGSVPVKTIYSVDATARTSAGHTIGDIIDVCGDSGHHRSLNGLTWTADALGIPCVGPSTHALARSPYDPNVLFVNHGSPLTVSMSTNGGTSWTNMPGLTLASPVGRVPTVRTHTADNTGNTYYLYASNPNDFYRLTCSRTTGCPTSGWVAVKIGHADVSDMAWASLYNCPRFASGDFGIATLDTPLTGADCGTNFKIVRSGPTGLNALQIPEITGQVHQIPDRVTDLYFVAMDNHMWASIDGGLTWPNEVCCEGLGLQVAHSGSSHDGQLLTGLVCFGCSYFKSTDHLKTKDDWSVPGSNQTGNHGEPILLPDGRYVQRAEGLDTSGASKCCYLFLSSSVDTGWTRKAFVGDSSRGNYGVAGTADNPVLVGTRGSGGTLIRISNFLGDSQTGSVTDISTGLTSLASQCLGEAAFACPYLYGVAPNADLHIVAEDASTGTVKSEFNSFVFATNPQLSDLVTMGGTLTHDRDRGKSQVRSIAFDPHDPQRILVGTEAAGIIASLDGGITWGRVPGSEAIPAISSFFFDEVQNQVWVSSYGRGLWKVRFDPADLSVTTAVPERIGSSMPAVIHVAVSNANGTAAAASLVDLLPPEVTFVRSSLVDQSGTDRCRAIASSSEVVKITGSSYVHPVLCDLGDMTGGVVRSFDIIVKGTDSTGGCLLRSNRTYVGSVSTDRQPADNQTAQPFTFAGPNCPATLSIVGGILTSTDATAIVASVRGSVNLEASAFVRVGTASIEALQVTCSAFRPNKSGGSLFMSGIGLVSGAPWLIRADDMGTGVIAPTDRLGIAQGPTAQDGSCGAGTVSTEPLLVGDLIQFGTGGQLPQ